MYFDPSKSWETVRQSIGGLAEDAAGYAAEETREKALASGERFDTRRVLRYVLRPFEVQWCYYTQITEVWNRARPALFQHYPHNKGHLITRPSGVASREGVPFYWTQELADFDSIRGHSYHFPVQLRPNPITSDGRSGLLSLDIPDLSQPNAIKPNYSQTISQYLSAMGVTSQSPHDESTTVWLHILAVGFCPAYLAENSDAVSRDWPRIPLPNSWEILSHSASLGKAIAELLDVDSPVWGQGTGGMRAELRLLGVLTAALEAGFRGEGDDLALTVGWGHSGASGTTMPGRGRIQERTLTRQEHESIEHALTLLGVDAKEGLERLGMRTYDVYLNERAYWCNIPLNVWDYRIGGYQVIKKWLSYRERDVLGRPLTTEEARYVTEMVRRLAAIVLMGQALDDNYRRVKANTYTWPAEG